jgi:hypothetical protein
MGHAISPARRLLGPALADAGAVPQVAAIAVGDFSYVDTFGVGGRADAFLPGDIMALLLAQ